jgi:hypothetical protein
MITHSAADHVSGGPGADAISLAHAVERERPAGSLGPSTAAGATT